MATLNDLSPEILLIVASYLPQTDLLNLSLTTHRLRSATEYELFREYHNPHLHRRSLKPFILRLLNNQKLAHNVLSVAIDAGSYLNAWHFFMNAPNDELFPGTTGLTRSEYEEITQAAVAQGIITRAFLWDDVTQAIVAFCRAPLPQDILSGIHQYFKESCETVEDDNLEDEQGDVLLATEGDGPLDEDFPNDPKVDDGNISQGSDNGDSDESSDDGSGSDMSSEYEDGIAPWDVGFREAGYVSGEDDDLADDELCYRYDPWKRYVSQKLLDDADYSVKFCTMLYLGFKEPWILMLLHLVPNVRKIDLLRVPSYVPELAWRVSPNKLGKLRRFTAYAEHDDGPWALGFFDSVLQRSNMEVLEVYGADAWRFEVVFVDSPLSLQPRCTHISTFVLERCTLTKESLSTLLGVTETLKSLRFTSGNSKHYGEYGYPKNFTATELVEILQPHKNTLEELTLDLHTWWIYDFPAGYLPSLREFTRLKTIDTWTITYGDLLLDEDNIDRENPLPNNLEHLRDRMPPFLEHLTLRPSKGNNEISDTRQLVDLVQNRLHSQPRFKKLTFVGRNNCFKWSQDTLCNALSSENLADPVFEFEFIYPNEYDRRSQTVFSKPGKSVWKPVHRHRQPIRITNWKDGMYVNKEEMLPTPTEVFLAQGGRASIEEEMSRSGNTGTSEPQLADRVRNGTE